jgi:hypothetical protein
MNTPRFLSELRGQDGFIHCVFLCCDLPYQYVGEYFQKLGDRAAFPTLIVAVEVHFC